MSQDLDERLETWARDPNMVCVLLRGKGTRAFCSGGEVRSLAQACQAHPGAVPPLASVFFAAEYRLDYRLHTYPKPVLCWAHGYVLGGGMGLLQGAAIRIVTPSSRLAMPEIGIGLYPDVGDSWFLSRLPGKLGLLLGLTGAQMNARDAIDLGLADRLLGDDQQEELIEGLLRLNWQEQTAMQLNSLLKALERQARDQQAQPQAQWLPLRERIDELLDVSDVHCAWKALAQLAEDPDKRLARARHLSLAQVFQMEYTLSLNCCRHPEFSEGVRARLIDKDGEPRWHWPDIAAVPEAVVEAHFHKAWEGRHPLADLSDY